MVPLIYGEDLRDLSIRQLQIDGNIPYASMKYRGGDGIYLKNCQRVIMRDIYSHNNNGDGIGFEISNDVTVENCLVENNALSIHAGSGSLRMNVRNNKIINNKLGFYFCWGIQQGILENNEINHNATYGVSVGFHDSNNIIRRNKIIGNGEVGIIFRAAQHPSQSPRDDTVADNLIENNGPKDGATGIQIGYEADNIKILGNKITEKRRGKKSCGILIEKTVKKVQILNNVIAGFKKDIQDYRPKKEKLTTA